MRIRGPSLGTGADDSDDEPDFNNQPTVGVGEKDLDSGSAGNPTDHSERDDQPDTDREDATDDDSLPADREGDNNHSGPTLGGSTESSDDHNLDDVVVTDGDDSDEDVIVGPPGRGERDLDSGGPGGAGDGDGWSPPESVSYDDPTDDVTVNDSDTADDTEDISDGNGASPPGMGEKDLDSGSAGNESEDYNDRDENTTGGITQSQKQEGTVGNNDPDSGTAGNTDETPEDELTPTDDDGGDGDNGTTIGGHTWTGLPGFGDIGPEGDTPEDLPETSYTDPGDFDADDVGGNDGTGSSIVDSTPVEQDGNGGVDVDETLDNVGIDVPELEVPEMPDPPQLPGSDVPWKLVGAGVAVGAAVWLFRPYAGLADSAAN